MVLVKDIFIAGSLATNILLLGYIIVDRTKEPVINNVEVQTEPSVIKLEPIRSVVPSKPAPKKIFLAPLPSAPKSSEMSLTNSEPSSFLASRTGPSSAAPSNSNGARPQMPSTFAITEAVKKRFSEENMGLKKTNLFQEQEEGKVVTLKKKEVVKKSSPFANELAERVAKLRNNYDEQAATESEVKTETKASDPLNETSNQAIIVDDLKSTETAVESGEVVTTSEPEIDPSAFIKNKEIDDFAKISGQFNGRRSTVNSIIPDSTEGSSDSRKAKRQKKHLIDEK